MTAAQKLVNASVDQHQRIAIDLDHDQDLAPLWVLHLPSGGRFRIKSIGVRGPLVRFIGFGASATECDYVLAAPESVVISILSLPPDSDEPRTPIGFAATVNADSDGTNKRRGRRRQPYPDARMSSVRARYGGTIPGGRP